MLHTVLFLLLAMFFAGAAGRSAAAVRDAFPAVSMRFEQALTEQEIKRLNEYIPENSLGISQAAYWTERRESIRNERNGHETQTEVIFFAGDGTLVWPHSFLSGGYPGEGDLSGCAVSAGLADQIFGSTDAAGLAVTISGTEYCIRGIWESPDPAAMIQLKTADPVFENMEVLIRTDRDYREAAMDLARDNQLAPAATVNGPAVGALCVLAAHLPYYLAGLALILKIISGCLLRRTRLRIRLPAALLAAAVILMMCGLNGSFPDYLVPTKWSDFEYWGRMASDYRSQLIELISLVPASKDVFFRLETLRLGAYLFAATAAVTAYLPYALKRWTFQPARIVILMHLIWSCAAWMCIIRFPAEVRLMYLLCSPFPVLFALRSVEDRGEIEHVHVSSTD